LGVPDAPDSYKESDVGPDLLPVTQIRFLGKQTESSNQKEVREEVQEANAAVTATDLPAFNSKLAMSVQIPDKRGDCLIAQVLLDEGDTTRTV
jgi:hypothetical protein